MSSRKVKFYCDEQMEKSTGGPGLRGTAGIGDMSMDMSIVGNRGVGRPAEAGIDGLDVQVECRRMSGAGSHPRWWLQKLASHQRGSPPHSCSRRS